MYLHFGELSTYFPNLVRNLPATIFSYPANKQIGRQAVVKIPHAAASGVDIS